MSYDLFFCVGPGKPPLTLADFRSHFVVRPHYELEGLQAFYHNESTGVYFCFEYDDELAEDDPPVDMTYSLAQDEGENDGESQEPSIDDQFTLASMPSALVAFRMNFCRPHVFGLEAEPEVQAFVREFGLRVEDPQDDGMGCGSYSRRGFLSGWNTGNRWGMFALAQYRHESEERWDPLVLPSGEIEKYWQWNYRRRQLQKQLGLFVPRISFFREGNRVMSFVIWGDAGAIALPEVDRVVLFRRDYSAAAATDGDIAVVDYSELGEVFALASRVDDVLPYRLMDYRSPPQPVASFFHRQTPCDVELEGVSMEDILDAEMVQEAADIDAL